MQPSPHGGSVWIHQGQLARATVNLNTRPLVDHAHREYNIIIKLGGADAIFRTEQQDLILNDDALLIFNPWLQHAKISGPEAPSLLLSLLVQTEMIAQILPSAPLVDALFANQLEKMTPDVQFNANRLAAVITAPVPAAAACDDMLFDLISSIVSNYARPGAVNDVIAQARPVDYRIRRAIGMINERAVENLKVEDIAKQVGLSRSRFFEQFRSCTGVSPQRYIDWARLSVATKMLGNTDRPLLDIAEELGFSAHSHFTRFFVQHVGVVPSEFRRQTARDLEM